MQSKTRPWAVGPTVGIITVVASMVGVALVAVVYPPLASAMVGSRPASALRFLAWQGTVLSMWLLILRMRPRTSRWLGQWLMAGIPLFLGINGWLHQWTGIRLFSRRLVELIRDVPVEIVSFATVGVGISIAGLVIAWVTAMAIAIGCQLILQMGWPRFEQFERRCRLPFALVCVVMTIGLQIGDPFDHHAGPAENPLASAPVLPLVTHSATQLATQQAGDTELHLQRLIQGISAVTDRRIGQLRMNVVVPSESPTAVASESSIPHPDILIIIGESLRPELLTPEVMPHSFALTRRGMWLRQHYSGGNASSLGAFSIVSGLEAVWFYKSDVRFAPAMNRLFRQAGYELGFFASTNDWSTFQMDAFFSRRHYDVFQSEDFTGLASDGRAIDATAGFLNSDSTRPPRLAVLCLYGTHAPFWCDEDSSTDIPAASDSYPIPFSASWRTRVENRYRNAARTLDSSIAELLRRSEPSTSEATTTTNIATAESPGNHQRPCIVLLTGDHGESFGGDGTIGHGTKLSVDQTQTLAVLAGTGIPTVQRDHASGHFDFLPTLMSAAGIATSMPGQFDGRVLTSLDNDSRVAGGGIRRSFSISGYIGKEVGIIGDPAKFPAAEPWALRCRFSLLDGTARVEHWIGRNGDPMDSGPNGKAALAKWLARLPGSPQN